MFQPYTDYEVEAKIWLADESGENPISIAGELAEVPFESCTATLTVSQSDPAGAAGAGAIGGAASVGSAALARRNFDLSLQFESGARPAAPAWGGIADAARGGDARSRFIIAARWHDEADGHYTLARWFYATPAGAGDGAEGERRRSALRFSSPHAEIDHGTSATPPDLTPYAPGRVFAAYGAARVQAYTYDFGGAEFTIHAENQSGGGHRITYIDPDGATGGISFFAQDPALAWDTGALTLYGAARPGSPSIARGFRDDSQPRLEFWRLAKKFAELQAPRGSAVLATPKISTGSPAAGAPFFQLATGVKIAATGIYCAGLTIS